MASKTKTAIQMHDATYYFVLLPLPLVPVLLGGGRRVVQCVVADGELLRQQKAARPTTTTIKQRLNIFRPRRAAVENGACTCMCLPHSCPESVTFRRADEVHLITVPFARSRTCRRRRLAELSAINAVKTRYTLLCRKPTLK